MTILSRVSKYLFKNMQITFVSLSTLINIKVIMNRMGPIIYPLKKRLTCQLVPADKHVTYLVFAFTTPHREVVFQYSTQGVL